jgi:predicted RNA-binding Zn-ribbon protein involved in translation (DUF1610 family)
VPTVSNKSALGLKYDTVIPVWGVYMEMTPSISTTERQPADKATLYCPACGHESHINGDWIIHVLADSLTYECPNCEAVIDSRRNQGELAAGSGGSLHFTAQN